MASSVTSFDDVIEREHPATLTPFPRQPPPESRDR